MSIRAHKSQGFTLLELLVVIAIAAMLATLVRPMYSAAVPGARLRTEVLELATSLRNSRYRAVSSHGGVRILFDSDGSRYTIGDKTPVALRAGTVLTVANPLSEHWQGLSAIEPRYELTFYPDGSSTGAAITLRNGTTGYRVDVDWLTSRLRVAGIDDDQP